MGRTSFTRSRKALCVTLVLLEGTLYCGSLQGWPALVYIFKDAHFYSHLCSNASAPAVSAYNRSADEEFTVRLSHECPEQDEMLNLVFTVAIFMQVVMPLLGFIYDHCGKTCARALSTILSAGGLVLMAVSRPGLEWVLFPGASAHFVGGAMLLSTDMTMPLLFPTRKSTLRSLLNGVANMSAFSLLLVKLAYDQGIPYGWSLMFFAGLTCLISIPTTLVLPTRHYVHESDVNKDDADVKENGRQPGSKWKTRMLPNNLRLFFSKDTGGKGTADGFNKEDAPCQDRTISGTLLKDTTYSKATVEANHLKEMSTIRENGASSLNGNDDSDEEQLTETLLTKEDSSSTDSKKLNKNHHNLNKGLCTESEKFTPTDEGEIPPSWEESDDHVTVLPSKRRATTMSFKTVLKQPMFWWSELWFAGNLLLVMMYFGSFNSMINFRSNHDIEQVSLYTNVVGFVQVAISIPSAALVGYLVDRQQQILGVDHDPKTFIPSFLITSISGLLVWILCAIPTIELQFPAMMLHCVLRSSAFGVFTAFIAYAFPIKHFGKVYTVQRAIMALFCGLQFPLFYWLKNNLQSDPLYFSLVMVGISCLTFSLPVYVLRQSRHDHHKHSTAKQETVD